MKRLERHRLKENDIEAFARQARERFESRKRETTAVLVALAVILVVGVGYWAWRARIDSRAHALLAEALTVQQARVGPPAVPGTRTQELPRTSEDTSPTGAAASRQTAATAPSCPEGPGFV